MKDKIKIIYLCPFVMTKFIWTRYEFDFYKDLFDFEVHELIDFLHPNFRENYGKTYANNKIVAFKKLADWKNYMKNILLESNKKKIKILTFAELENYPSVGDKFEYLAVYRFLKINNIPYVQCLAPGYPLISTGKKKYFNTLHIFRYWKYVLLAFKRFFLDKIRFILKCKPKSIFVAGKFYKQMAVENKKFNQINLINFNSWEYSSTIIEEKQNLEKLVKEKYAIYLNPHRQFSLDHQGSANKKEDSLMYGISSPETIEEYCVLLDNFFSNIERIFNLKVIIASHPKSLEEGNLSYLGNRKAFCNKTSELVKGCEFVISRNSTSLNYAVIYRKPLIFFYSNQTKKSFITYYHIKFLANMLKTKSININDKIDENLLKSLNKFDLEAYKNYETNYLSSNPNKKNYTILLDEVKNILGIVD